MHVERPASTLLRVSLIVGLLFLPHVICAGANAQAPPEPTLAERVVKDSGELPRAWDAADVTVGPGGHHFVYPRRGETRFVWFDGVKSREYDKVLRPTPLTWSPDGTHVAWVAEVDGRQFVVLDGREGKHYDGIADEARVRFYPVFSPDSRHLAYWARTGDKCVCVLDGKEGQAYDLVEQVRFSADGQHLAYVAGHGGKEFVVRDGKEGPPYDEVCIYDVAPGGTRVAYTGRRGGKRFVVCDGRESPPYDDIGRVRFSPDGRRLAYGAKRGDDWFIVVDGREGPAYDRLTAVEFSGDGRHLAYSAQRDHRGFVVLDGQEQTPSGGWPHFSPDGKLVYAAYHTETKTWSYVYDGKLWPCGTSPERWGQPLPMVFTPDGGHFAYYAYEKGKGVWMVRDGRAGRAFRSVRHPRWSPDGGHFFHGAVSKEGPHHIVCDGMVSALGRSAYWPTFSEDNLHLAYRIREEDRGDRVVCDGVKGPAHREIRGLKAVGGKLRYVALDEDRVRIVEVDWPAGRTWRDGFRAVD